MPHWLFCWQFDMVDPGVVLMWIFGVMLGLFWILYFLCGEMFDTASVAMLALMTLAFMVPFLVARIPFNTPWNTSWDEQMPPENLDRTSTYYGAARYRAVRRASRSRNRRAFHSDKVPPRPHARLQGPGS
ncbi:unnamed protein product [Ostreobium quekettii]|uniref:Uncharacterized protein n=1 Tax=Ostreobium quekettii TaxID=121088 RepID=A0A8S1IWM0_9CHLO|nr:unnamed protein product [Ostreobium quekettii]